MVEQLASQCLALQGSDVSEEQWLSVLPGLVETHGLEAVCAWYDSSNKHKHRLVHSATIKCFVRALKCMRDLGFNLNAQRDSDQCTPLHLAIFYKKHEAIDALKELGVDTTLENSYGESCDAKYEKLAESMHNLIFLDLELTHGQYDASWSSSRILELALIVTDKDLKELDRGHWVVGGFSSDELNCLSEFHQKTFRDAKPGGTFPPLPGTSGNGLFTDVLGATTSKAQVEQEVLKLLRKHCVEKASPLAGNSIQCDREVLLREMPAVYGFLNHRIVDVSSFTGMMERWLPESEAAWKAAQIQQSNYNHRAMNDVESSIKCMQWIRLHLLVQPASSDHQHPA
jgi:oligoribonuclease